MATLGGLQLGLTDLIQRLDPKGDLADVVNPLVATNECLDDIFYQEGNLTDGHKSSVVIAQTGGVWRKLYGGVPKSKNGVATVTDTFGMLEKICETDAELVRLSGNESKFITNEHAPSLGALGEQVATSMFYDNSRLDPERPTGLTSRFPSLATSNVISAGGSASDSMTSIWLVVHGPRTFFAIYPKGSKAGIDVKDYPATLIPAPDGVGDYEAYRTHYKNHFGWCLKNWTGVVRICNVPADCSSVAIEEKMIAAMAKCRAMKLGSPVFYMNEGIRVQLDIRAMKKSNVNFPPHDVWGREVPNFRGIPIHQCDALVQTEAVVS